VGLLYCLDCIEQDALQFLNLNLLDAGELMAIKYNLKQFLCREAIRPNVMGLVDGLGVDEDLLWRPIAKDWVQFNKGDNYGEVVDTGRFLTDKS
jgi:hypothetical protein